MRFGPMIALTLAAVVTAACGTPAPVLDQAAATSTPSATPTAVPPSSAPTTTESAATDEYTPTPTRSAVSRRSAEGESVRSTYAGGGSGTEVSQTAGAAPVGQTATGTWWSAPPDGFTAASLWFFDPVNEAIPYGWRRDYQPTGTITPFSRDFDFVYTQSGARFGLSFPTGTRQSLTVLRYDAASDTMLVNWEGYTQVWVGCRSGRMPPLAQAACR